MTVLLSLAKNFLIPGSTWFLVTGIGLALVLLARERTFRWGRRWLAALFLLYVALSMPLVSDWLNRGLSGTRPITDAREARGATTIVLLGNGVTTVGTVGTDIDLPNLETALNVSEAARLYRLLGGGRIIASGGIPRPGVARRPESEVMRDYLTRLEHPGSRHRPRIGLGQYRRAGPARRISPSRRIARAAGDGPLTPAARYSGVPRPRAQRRARDVGVASGTRPPLGLSSAAGSLCASRERNRLLRVARVCLLPARGDIAG